MNTIKLSIIELIVSTIISTGVIATFLSHWYDKKLHTHEIKIQKYVSLVEELAKLAANDADWVKLRVLLNEALIFASDEAVEAILNFNNEFTNQRTTAEGGNFQMKARDLQPLIVAIRKDLDLKSKSIEKKGLSFFQKPKQ